MQPIRKLENPVVARRSAKLVRVTRTLNAVETNELQRLFDVIADTCDAANMLLGVDSGPERLRQLTERIAAMIDRTKSILG
jgi:hypothetical protein